MLKIKDLVSRQAIFMLGGAPTVHEVLPESSRCPRQMARKIKKNQTQPQKTQRSAVR